MAELTGRTDSCTTCGEKIHERRSLIGEEEEMIWNHETFERTKVTADHKALPVCAGLINPMGRALNRRRSVEA